MKRLMLNKEQFTKLKTQMAIRNDLLQAALGLLKTYTGGLGFSETESTPQDVLIYIALDVLADQNHINRTTEKDMTVYEMKAT